MNIRNYFRKNLAGMALAGSIFLSGCDEPEKLQNMPDVLYQLPKLKLRIDQESVKPNEKPDKYAVLINGADELRFTAELSLIYQVLLENDFKREDIYILDSNGREDFFYPADDIANRSNIETIFQYLGKKVDEQDILVVHISDHGVRGVAGLEEVTEVSLPSGNVSEVDLERYLSGIKPKYGIITTEICYGGGLAHRLGKGRYIGISQTTEKDFGYSTLRNSFGGFFYQAFRNSKESDKNKDGRVTIDEAFNYAKEKHSWSRDGKVNPQMVSELDVKKISIR